MPISREIRPLGGIRRRASRGGAFSAAYQRIWQTFGNLRAAGLGELVLAPTILRAAHFGEDIFYVRLIHRLE